MFPDRIFSGMRPTGSLHLGHYHGVLKNWVRLQSEYPCFFAVVDWHALTTHYETPEVIEKNVWEVLIDWLASGIDPAQATLFIQSKVPEHAELALLLGMSTPLGWLERVPSYKEQQENIKGKDLTTYGFLGYPCLQAADILIYKADVVPVGEDQVAHVELTREIARRFNLFYPKKVESEKLTPDQREWCTKKYSQVLINSVYVVEPIFPEPQSLLTPAAKLPGTDGRKMSKSYGNTILLTDPEPVVRQKLKTMVTDPARVRRSDPGDPDVCPVGDLHKVFSGPETLLKVYEGCRSAGIGCIECKGWAADAIVAELEPIQQRRRQYEEQPRLVHDILHSGSELARVRAEETMKQVREAMHLLQPESGERAL